MRRSSRESLVEYEYVGALPKMATPLSDRIAYIIGPAHQMVCLFGSERPRTNSPAYDVVNESKAEATSAPETEVEFGVKILG